MKTFDELYAELIARVESQDPESSTVKMVQAGVHAVGKKIVEEAAEVWMAAEHESAESATEEISQLLYWTQVLMITRGITLEEVYGKL